MALGCMLAQLDDLGKERAIYYLSKRMLEYECKYIMIECLCLALVWATRRLRHYMTEYSVLLVSRLDPLRYLFDSCSDIGRLMRWLVLLIEFDIHYVTNITGWRLYFDGAANQSGFGIGILLISPQGDHIPRSVRPRRKSVHRASQCGSAEEVLCVRSWSEDGWPSLRICEHWEHCVILRLGFLCTRFPRSLSTSPFPSYSDLYMVESPHSHGSAIFDITHTGVWHYLFGNLGLYVDRSPLLRGISRVTYCLSIQFTCLRP
ncbi:hypothetical protein AAG906_008921 [Vitis piasezkii]